MTADDYRKLAGALLPVVLEAGRIEMAHYNSGVGVETKADLSPVTAADRDAEAVILAGLARAAPDIPVIAEEAASAGKIPEIGSRFFLVDPLDGTKEFIHQRGEFTVNIALVENGVPAFGIVYAPALSALFVTMAPDEAVEIMLPPSSGAISLAGCKTTPLRTRKINPTAVTAVASRSHSNEATESFLSGFNIAQRISAGSSLKFCLLARGEADLYPRLAPTMEWDTAAGHAVLLAAGGAVLTPDGAPLTYGRTSDGYRNASFIAWGGPPIAATR